MAQDSQHHSLPELSASFNGWREGQTCSITFVVTENCQLRCKYCYICGKNSFNVMTFDKAKEAIEYILTRPELFLGSVIIVLVFLQTDFFTIEPKYKSFLRKTSNI